MLLKEFFPTWTSTLPFMGFTNKRSRLNEENIDRIMTLKCWLMFEKYEANNDKNNQLLMVVGEQVM